MYKKKLLSAGAMAMGWYLLVTFIIPLINNYKDGYAHDFIEHSIFIIGVPALLICLVYAAVYCFAHGLGLKKYRNWGRIGLQSNPIQPEIRTGRHKRIRTDKGPGRCRGSDLF